MDPTKAAKAGEGRKLLKHKIGTDIGQLRSAYIWFYVSQETWTQFACIVL